MEVLRKQKSRWKQNWPKERSGHRVVASSNCIFVFGGYSNPRTSHIVFKELWRYNLSLESWTLLNLSYNEFPDHVASSSVGTIGQYLFTFGGTGYPFGENSSNDLHVADLATGSMFKQPATGDIPIASYGHGCAIDTTNKKMYIVGGTTGLTFSSEVHCLDLVTKSWRHLKCNSKPIPARYRHEIALDNNKLYVFGGGTASVTYELNEIPYFDLNTHRWETAPTLESDVGTSGFPEARKYHSGFLVPSTELSDAKYIISGGMRADVSLDDIWSLNLRTLQWAKYKTKLPIRLHFHDASVTSTGKMVVFGGLTISDRGPAVRQNFLAFCRVVLPPLQELAWEVLLKHYPQITTTPISDLNKIGIPKTFSGRLL